ncbi:phytoene desaturase family protein [Pseudonocardia acaciae]|uniref:phytoene desaturase family protein n=1 Tax=Pseudonocardia acaciae TaxID=551276 RepID=UPI00055A8DF2|nr:NAD(P)/FAD-dependent oxidoreductase [Pseudonocardia acaciae]
MTKSVVVVGAGIAGLSVGCYLQMNGYRTRIVEQHDLPGGLCTSWRRGRYVFDNCLQWLVGSGPGNSLYDAWQELGAVQDRDMVDHDEFVRVIGADGTALVVYTDVDRLERHLCELAPEDARRIRKLTGLVRRHARFDLPLGKPSELMSVPDRLKAAARALPFLWSLARYGRVSLPDFAAGFRHPLLRTAFTTIIDTPDFPLLGLCVTLAWMHNRAAGYPIGGSLEFIRAIERRYLALGGQVEYGARVDRILVEDAHAVGVRCADGGERRSDYVISASDAHTAVYEMLGGRFVDDGVRARYQESRIFPPLVRVSLGIARDISAEPHAVVQLLPEPLVLGGVEQRSISIRHYCYDPTMAEPGTSSVAVILGADYDHWRSLADDPAAYAEEKERIAAAVIGVLERRFPGVRDQIEEIDVATPLTFERYTGNWRGSYEGLLITTENLTCRPRKTLPGLDNFYLVGHWVAPGGGLPSGVLTGREVAQLICARDGRPFRTSKGAPALDRS